MDRGRRASLTGSSDARRRGKPLPPVSERSGPYGQMVEPEAVKFGGSMIAADVQEDKDSLAIDPNLLVGPLYVSDTAGKTGRIKDQITDITDKLHRTLHTFDEFDDFEHEDPLVNMMRKRIGEVDDQNMQFQLNSVMNQYEDMAAQLTDANRERDEMLFQLADWFTTDHIDLEDIKTSIDDSEEDNIKQSYFETVTNFEKLKKLQQKITDASTKGKPTRQLNAKKVELEKDVVDKFKIMKDMSMQTMKLKISDDAPWKHAANEIVSMLKNVRGENAEELAAITKNMKEMIEQLEKQAMTIKSLTAELREKKEVVKNLTDENGDLNQDVMVLRARYIRYEKELDAAKTMIRKLHKQQLVDGEITKLPPEDIGKSLTESISKVLNRVDDRPGGLKRLGSDPAMLRTQIREIQDDLDCIRSEYAKKAEEMDELNTELLEKKEYIRSIEEENEKFSKELKKLRQQRRQSIAAGVVPPAEGESHQCEHCKCHVPEKDIDEEIEELKKEVQKWQDKCNYFKKCLADTEMKLSQAYKDISDLRMERESFPSDEPAEKPKEKKKEEKPKETTKEESKTKDDVEPKKEPKERKEPKEKKPPKPKQEVKPKYLEQSKRTERKLPPIDKMQPEPLDETVPLTDKQYRELNLYKVGDLQGKLNMLANEIMDFVTEVGKMLFTEKDETKKVQAVTAFSFGQDGNQGKKAKETIDPKEQEAKQKKSQVIFNGQHAVSKLREAFDMLSNSLGLQHTEYEMIYRSFKISQQRQAIRREIMIGRLPVTALRDFDIKMGQENKEIAEHAMLSSYYNISYGGTGGGPSMSNKPRNMLHRKTSSISSIRSESPETESKLKETMHVLKMQRSRSDLDVRADVQSIGGGSLYGAGLMRERSQIFLGNVPEHVRRESLQQTNKQEVKISKAVVPRKGLIQLSTGETEGLDPFGVIGEKRTSVSHDLPHPGSGGKTRSLIKRKDILEQIKMGNRLLEEYEEQKQKDEEMTKTLGEYTMLDLQSHILDLTDAKSLKRKTSGMLDSPAPGAPTPTRKPKQKPAPKEKVTLPAINNFTPFG